MLIEPDQGSAIQGLKLPGDLYWVLRSPAPLAGMTLPHGSWPWSAIHAAGFSHVVSLHPYSGDPAPLSFIFKRHLEDLFHGGPPKRPEHEVALITDSVDKALTSVRSGQGVVVHCWGGRGRTGTVLGCILRELGHDGEATVDYLSRVHQARGKDGWPESPWQADLVRSWKRNA